MQALARRGMLVALAACCLGACSMNTRALVAGSSCVEGQSVACSCAGDAAGVRTCQADGTLGECECSGVGAGGTDPSDPTSVGGSQPGDGAGSGGSGSGGAGSGASAGSGGSTGGSSGGGAGSSGPDAGGGAGGGDPNAGAAATGGTMSTPDPPPGLYASCAGSASCMDGLECLVAQRGLPGDYCTLRCRNGQGMVTVDCAPPATGTVAVECNALSGLCQLASCQAATCPDGLTCTSAWGGFAGMFCGF